MNLFEKQLCRIPKGGLSAADVSSRQNLVINFKEQILRLIELGIRNLIKIV